MIVGNGYGLAIYGSGQYSDDEAYVLPIVSSINEDEQANVEEIAPHPSYNNEIENVAVQHEPSVTGLQIGGYLNQELHPDTLSIDEQRANLKDFAERDVEDNWIEYREYKGYLLIEDVSFPKTSDSSIVDEVIIDGRYFPWPKYEF